MTQRTRINLADAVMDLHPPPPPCFINRLQWIEYLKAAAAAQNHVGEPKVIVIVAERPEFNYEFDFCADCTKLTSIEMMDRHRCKPKHLIEMKGKK